MGLAVAVLGRGGAGGVGSGGDVVGAGGRGPVCLRLRGSAGGRDSRSGGSGGGVGGGADGQPLAPLTSPALLSRPLPPHHTGRGGRKKRQKGRRKQGRART